jgi:hypothetical protein
MLAHGAVPPLAVHDRGLDGGGRDRRLRRLGTGHGLVVPGRGHVFGLFFGVPQKSAFFLIMIGTLTLERFFKNPYNCKNPNTTTFR